MKCRYAIAYAYPGSTNAQKLGMGNTGAYYVEGQTLREDQTWSPPYIAHGCDGFDAPDDIDLLALLDEYKAVA